MGNTNPEILDLDVLETPEMRMTIRYKGKAHKMRELTVEAFIEQQKRATAHEETVASRDGDNDLTDEEARSGMEIMRDSVREFFPTLPVNELPMSKLFHIFNWLNEMSTKANEDAAGDAVETANADTAGNEPAPEENGG